MHVTLKAGVICRYCFLADNLEISICSFFCFVLAKVFSRPYQEPVCRLYFFLFFSISEIPIDRFAVVYSVTWPLCGSEAAGDLALIQTSLLLSCICA